MSQRYVQTLSRLDRLANAALKLYKCRDAAQILPRPFAIAHPE
jgi:hypothetical protein